jgi:DNA repair protein RadC
MKRYIPSEEQIFLIGGRDNKGNLILVDEDHKESFVSNPKRRPKKETIELPMGAYEDLRIRVGLVRSSSYGKYPDVKISCSNDVASLMRPMCNEPQEVLSVILLDQGNIVTGICEIHRGGTKSTMIEPISIFKPVIISNASRIIIVHNHPTGRPTHSRDDTETCQALLAGSNLLGIDLLDFIIVGTATHESYADMGLVL